ncbi:MAG: hypothetical protein CMB95_02220 [Flavobacteriaceae bacterium]|nr:hypothetical protein [Flavobacteriaceae bacterium]
MAQKKKKVMTVTEVQTPVRNAAYAEHIAAAHDAVLNLVDMNMTDDFDSRFANQVSGEENPKFNSSAHFTFGSRAKASGVALRKKRERFFELEHQYDAEVERNGPESTKLINLGANKNKAEAEWYTLDALHQMDVDLYNTMHSVGTILGRNGAEASQPRIWNDGKHTEDHGEAWFEKECNRILERKVLSPQVDTPKVDPAELLAKLKRSA